MSETQSKLDPSILNICPEEAIKQTYDAVIVGSGVAGGILAMKLTQAGYNVLILEAAPGGDLFQSGYQKKLEYFYQNPVKDNNSPFPINPNAEMPRSPDLSQLAPGQVSDYKKTYIVQRGPYVSDSVYSKSLGGTTSHWEAKAIRMLRDDLKLNSNYGVGLDWPIDLETLMPYYEDAEYLLGVSGDVDQQKSVGVEFSDEYVYPMVELKPSYLDRIVAKGSKGMKEKLGDKTFDIRWITFPQAKNADPNPKYKLRNGSPFEPIGAITKHQFFEGQRCQGNTNCVPLCPVQARFDSRKLFEVALRTGRAKLLTQAVASRVILDGQGRVTEIEFKRYEKPGVPDTNAKTYVVKGKVFILAANAVENARLMLASAYLNNQTAHPLMGKNLMDHPYLLCWGLLPVNAGVGRGPSCSSGLCDFRQGNFRKDQASFATDIHNDGWGWATGSPITDLVDLVDNAKLYGRALREELTHRLTRQLLLAYMIEMPASINNWIKVFPEYKDCLGNMQPFMRMEIPDYSMRTAEYARGLSRRIFQKLGAQDCTQYNPSNYGYLTYNGQGYEIRGGNHLAGTHAMGSSRENSVVDEFQKSWDHDNLYLVGPGSMPSIGSSNTTLTASAICLRTAEKVIKHLKSL